MPHKFTTLDGMRGVAALAVMAGHFSQHASTPIFQNARLAPDLFFCLSGFVLAYSYEERLRGGAFLADFVRRRVVRLYPLFLLGLILGALALAMKLAAGQTDLSPARAVLATGLNLFYLPYLADFTIQFGNEAFPSAIFPVNDPSWSLFFELAINLLFALWAWGGGRFVRLIPVLSAAALLATVAHLHQPEPGWGASTFAGGFPRTAFGFFSGVLIFRYRAPLARRLPKLPPGLLLLGIAAVFALPDLPHETLFWTVCVLLAVPAVVALGFVAETRSLQFSRLLGYLGWLSYPLYCLHFPLYSVVTTLRGSAEAPVWLVIALSAASILIAHAAGRWIDTPIRAWLGRRYARPVVALP